VWRGGDRAGKDADPSLPAFAGSNRRVALGAGLHLPPADSLPLGGDDPRPRSIKSRAGDPPTAGNRSADLGPTAAQFSASSTGICPPTKSGVGPYPVWNPRVQIRGLKGISKAICPRMARARRPPPATPERSPTAFPGQFSGERARFPSSLGV